MQPDLHITGLGVCSPIGIGREAFSVALLRGEQNFAQLARPGRQHPAGRDASGMAPFIGAELSAANLVLPERLSPGTRRSCSLSARVALACIYEAWLEAELHRLPPERIGLIVGGSNVQQRELVQTQDAYREKWDFLRPTYGLGFMDSDICGVCSEALDIRGFAYTLGGASASGLLAVIQAAQAVSAGQVDACIATGAMMDLSYWELQGLRALGAMGSERFHDRPGQACRPFDRDHDGFIYGENCAALVITRGATNPPQNSYARLGGWAVAMDGNRNPNPSLAGEARVIDQALRQARCAASDIDYVNPHGTGSLLGDETELQALKTMGFAGVKINATKSLTGHGLSAAGAIELAATLLQMRAGYLHPTRNLENPIDPDFQWVRGAAMPHRINNALKLSFGFGGINTAVCLHNTRAAD